MGISLTGLASGLDTNAMIEGLMKLERMPLINMEAHRKDLGNQQSVLRSINTKMTALKTAISDLMYTSSFNIAGGVSSNTGVVNIKTSDNAAHGVYNVSVERMATKHVVASTEVAVGATDLVSLVKNKKILINDNEFTLQGNTDDEILENLVKDINSTKTTDNPDGIGVTATLVNSKDGHKTLAITADKSGIANKIKIENDPSDSFDVKDTLKLFDDDRSAVNPQDAKFKVNGITIERSTNEISDVIQGVTLNLQSSGDSTITVKQDHDKIAEKFEAFVKAYNEVATLIKDNTGKEKLLQSNSTVRSLDMQLKSMINGLVGSEPGFKILSEIGLEIDKGIVDPKLMTGTINFDKEKFLQKLNESPDAVMEMFTKDTSGLAVRMNEMLGSWTNSVDGILTVAIKGYQSNIDLVDENMQRLLERLDKREEALQKQFAAMEVALSDLKNQQNWLAGQLNQLMTPVSKK